MEEIFSLLVERRTLEKDVWRFGIGRDSWVSSVHQQGPVQGHVDERESRCHRVEDEHGRKRLSSHFEIRRTSLMRGEQRQNQHDLCLVVAAWCASNVFYQLEEVPGKFFLELICNWIANGVSRRRVRGILDELGEFTFRGILASLDEESRVENDIPDTCSQELVGGEWISHEEAEKET